MIPFVQTAALILLISVWGGKSTGVESDPAVSMQGVERCVHALAEAEIRHFGIGRARDAISVLSAPRVDYLAESLARRKAREEKVAAQDLFRVPKVPTEGSFQAVTRPADKGPRPLVPTDASGSNPPTPRSATNGNGLGALPPHMQSPSQQQQQFSPGAQGAYGSPQGSVPSPYPTHYSPGGHLLDGPTPPDWGGSFLGVFPDFYSAENDPSMVSSSPASSGSPDDALTLIRLPPDVVPKQRRLFRRRRLLRYATPLGQRRYRRWDGRRKWIIERSSRRSSRAVRRVGDASLASSPASFSPFFL